MGTPRWSISFIGACPPTSATPTPTAGPTFSAAWRLQAQAATLARTPSRPPAVSRHEDHSSRGRYRRRWLGGLVGFDRSKANGRLVEHPAGLAALRPRRPSPLDLRWRL